MSRSGSPLPRFSAGSGRQAGLVRRRPVPLADRSASGPSARVRRPCRKPIGPRQARRHRDDERDDASNVRCRLLGDAAFPRARGVAACAAVTPAYPDPPLNDSVVALRSWSTDDLSAVRDASDDTYIPAITTVPSNYTDAEARAWIQRQHFRTVDGQGLSLAITTRDTGRAVGAIVLMCACAGVGTLGYWLVPRARGRGHARRAVLLLARWALTEARLARVDAFVEPDRLHP